MCCLEACESIVPGWPTGQSAGMSVQDRRISVILGSSPDKTDWPGRSRLNEEPQPSIAVGTPNSPCRSSRPAESASCHRPGPWRTGHVVGHAPTAMRDEPQPSSRATPDESSPRARSASADRRRYPGQCHGDRDIELAGQRLFGLDTLTVQSGQSGADRWVVGIQCGRSPRSRSRRARRPLRIEVDTPKIPIPIGTPRTLNPGRSFQERTHQRCHHQGRRRPVGCRSSDLHVRHTARLQLQAPYSEGLPPAPPCHDLVEKVYLVRAQVGRMGDRYGFRRSTHSLCSLVHDPTKQVRDQRLGRVRSTANQYRNIVAQPPLDLTHDPRRIFKPTPLRQLSDHRTTTGWNEED